MKLGALLMPSHPPERAVDPGPGARFWNILPASHTRSSTVPSGSFATSWVAWPMNAHPILTPSPTRISSTAPRTTRPQTAKPDPAFK
jgi:hypothetical protein